MSKAVALAETLAIIPKPTADAHECIVKGKPVQFESGTLLTYNGHRIATRVAVYFRDEDTMYFITAEKFAETVSRMSHDADEDLSLFISACPPIPYPPLAYSDTQLQIESNQITVFMYKDHRFSRVLFGQWSDELDESEVDAFSDFQGLRNIRANPTLNDKIYLMIRDHVDVSHIPNISQGRLNGLIDGESIMGESSDPKWGKRVRLLSTPKVPSSIDLTGISVRVFDQGSSPKNPSDNPTLFKYNYEVDKERWIRFLEDNAVVANPIETEDLYYAIMAGAMIGNSEHMVQSIDKAAEELMWKRASQGDKIVGIGPLTVDGTAVRGIIKGTRLEYPVPTTDFLISDAWKGAPAADVSSGIFYTYPTEYMSQGFHYSQLPISLYTYVDHEDELDDLQALMDGECTEEIIQTLEYPDGDEVKLRKTAALFQMSGLALNTYSAWFQDGLDSHLLSMMREKTSRKEFTLWKPLSFTVGKGIDELYLPAVDAFAAKNTIAKLVANRYGVEPQTLIDQWALLDPGAFMEMVNESHIEVIGFGVPTIPGFHTLHTLRLWDYNSIGINPRVAMSYKRDTDGDLFCCVIPGDQDE